MIAKARTRLRWMVGIVLLFVIAALASSAWVAMLWRSTQARRNAVATIEGFGGYVSYEHQYHPDGRAIIVDEVTGEMLPDGVFGPIVSLTHAPPPGPFIIRSLLWQDAFWRVKKITISDARPLRNEDLHVLQDIASATHLYVSRGPLYDAGVAHIAALTDLRKLDISRTYVADEGVRHLRGLPNLQELSLFGTRVTDAAIPDLAAMKSLTYINLGNTYVTPDGISALKEMRPDLPERSDAPWLLGEREPLPW